MKRSQKIHTRSSVDKYHELILKIESSTNSTLTTEAVAELVENVYELAKDDKQIDTLMTVGETADFLRVSRSYLNQARHKNAGPPFVRIGSRVLYRRSDIDDWCLKKVVSGIESQDE